MHFWLTVICSKPGDTEWFCLWCWLYEHRDPLLTPRVNGCQLRTIFKSIFCPISDWLRFLSDLLHEEGWLKSVILVTGTSALKESQILLLKQQERKEEKCSMRWSLRPLSRLASLDSIVRTNVFLWSKENGLWSHSSGCGYQLGHVALSMSLNPTET